jgi:L-lactate dehydrogenase complex protein LldF
LAKAKLIDGKKAIAMKLTSWLMQHPMLFTFAGKVARKVVPFIPQSIMYSKSNVWGKHRTMPTMPKNSFKELYTQAKKEK